MAIFRHMKICCPYCDGICEGCDWCNETGLCCPTCNGAGLLARHRATKGSALERCKTCQVEMSSGWEFDGTRAMQAIRAYIDDWFDGHIADEVESRRRECERVKAETEARRKASEPVWKHG